MTVFIEQGSGIESSLTRFFAQGKGRFEVEHIWADHHELHSKEFDSPADFSEARNMIGGLLLLPKKFNASYNDDTYEDKLPHYLGQNLLAKSLCPMAYKKNPGFLKFIEDHGLSFKAHPKFRLADMKARQALYQQVAELIWDPVRLDEELGS